MLPREVIEDRVDWDGSHRTDLSQTTTTNRICTQILANDTPADQRLARHVKQNKKPSDLVNSNAVHGRNIIPLGAEHPNAKSSQSPRTYGLEKLRTSPSLRLCGRAVGSISSPSASEDAIAQRPKHIAHFEHHTLTCLHVQNPDCPLNRPRKPSSRNAKGRNSTRPRYRCSPLHMKFSGGRCRGGFWSWEGCLFILLKNRGRQVTPLTFCIFAVLCKLVPGSGCACVCRCSGALSGSVFFAVLGACPLSGSLP